MTIYLANCIGDYSKLVCSICVEMSKIFFLTDGFALFFPQRYFKDNLEYLKIFFGIILCVWCFV